MRYYLNPFKSSLFFVKVKNEQSEFIILMLLSIITHVKKAQEAETFHASFLETAYNFIV